MSGRLSIWPIDRPSLMVKDAQLEGKRVFQYEKIEIGELECREMPHDETMLLMEQYDKLRNAWGLDIPAKEDWDSRMPCSRAQGTMNGIVCCYCDINNPHLPAFVLL